jgi:hypothetical protein
MTTLFPADDSLNSKCLKCGEDIAPSAKFCLKCGPSHSPQQELPELNVHGSDSSQPFAVKAKPKGGSIPLPLLVLGGLVVVVVLIMIVRTAGRTSQDNQPASTSVITQKRP